MGKWSVVQEGVTYERWLVQLNSILQIFLQQAPGSKKPTEIISYWHPNLTINLMDDHTPWVQGSVPQPMDECKLSLKTIIMKPKLTFQAQLAFRYPALTTHNCTHKLNPLLTCTCEFCTWVNIEENIVRNKIIITYSIQTQSTDRNAFSESFLYQGLKNLEVFLALWSSGSLKFASPGQLHACVSSFFCDLVSKCFT